MGWRDASIAGNGHIGAAVLGAYSNEKILINHALLKSGGYTGVLQDVSDKFPLIRKLYNEGKVLECEKLLESEFQKRGYKPSPDVPHPVGILNFDFTQAGLVTDYARVTDMESGEITTTFKADGTIFSRNLFVGRGSDIIGYTATKNGSQKINVVISGPDGTKYQSGFIYFSGKTGLNQVEYGLVSRIIVPNGSTEHTHSGIEIRDADSLTVFTKVFIGGASEEKFKILKTELLAVKNTYEKMQYASSAIHKRLFGATNLSLSSSDRSSQDTACLVAHAAQGQLGFEFIERAWNFAKYIILCAGGAPMVSGGLWSSGVGGLSFDNTAQLLYSTVTNSVDPDAIMKLFDYYDGYAQDLKKNAARVYGARGYFIPNTTSPTSALFGYVDAKTLHFIASSALAANLFYTYFLTTGDTKTLKSKIFPFMCEIFNFYSDFLKLNNDGVYSTVPSYSPNSTPGNTIGGQKLKNFCFATNSTIDFLAVGALLDNLIHSATFLGVKDQISAWQDMKTKIPAYSVNEQGCIKEYQNSAFVDNVQNNGVMHAYGLWPLKTFSFNDQEVSYKPVVGGVVGATISLSQASANAILARVNAGMYQNAGVLAMSAIQLAHTGQGDLVEKVLARLVASCYTPSILALSNDWRGGGFTSSTESFVDISGNIGFATAINECLIQSNYTTLRVLPAVFDGVRSGSATGLVTDFGARVSLDWDIGRGRLVLKIYPTISCKIDIEFNSAFRKLKSKEIKIDSQNVLRGVNLSPNKVAIFEF